MEYANLLARIYAVMKNKSNLKKSLRRPSSSHIFPFLIVSNGANANGKHTPSTVMGIRKWLGGGKRVVKECSKMPKK